MTVPYHDGADDQLELRDYLAVIRRRKGVIALVTLLTVAAAVAYSLLQTPIYRASTEVLIQKSASQNALNPTQQQTPQAIEQEIQTEIQIIRSAMIEDAVREELGYVPEVSVAAKGDTQVLAISATDTSAAAAARKANAYAEVYVEQRRQGTSDDLLTAAGKLQEELDRFATDLATAQDRVDELNGQLVAAPPEQQADLTAQRDEATAAVERLRESTDARRLSLLEQIDRLQLEATLNESRGARIVSQAEAPENPSSPKPVRNAAIAVVLGILLGIGAAFLRDHLDDSVRTKDDLELVTGGLSTLGLIPAVDAWRDRKTAVLESVEHPNGSPAEAYRGVRTSLQFLGIEQDLRTIQFTSANAGEGKTTTSSNVAVALARAGHTVLLVDCDLRRPRLHQFFGLDNSDGFTSILLGEKTRADTIVKIADVPRLAVLPSGPPPPAPSELLSTKAAREEIEGLTRFFDYVILDSPPLLPVADSIVLAGYADAVVLVASARSTTKRSIHRAVELLQQVNAPVAGTILNGVAPQDSYAYGGYGYVYEAKKA